MPGWTISFNRRATQRQSLLLPREEVVEIYEYCLAVAALRFGIVLHAWLAMSNHHHVVFTDRLGNSPAFTAYLNRLLAIALNAFWDRTENVWNSSRPCLARCVTPEDAFEQMIYTLLNAVDAHLVERVKDWPGASSFFLNTRGGTKVIKRPKFFSDRMPAEVTLEAAPPPGFEHLTPELFRAKVAQRLRADEDKLRAIRKREGIRVRGRAAVLAGKHTDRPTTPPPRGLAPEFICHDKELRRKEADDVRAFRAAHRRALERLRARERQVVFPSGTYRVKLFGVRTADELGGSDPSTPALAKTLAPPEDVLAGVTRAAG